MHLGMNQISLRLSPIGSVLAAPLMPEFGQAGANKSSTLQVRAIRLHPLGDGATKVGATEIGMAQIGAAQVGAPQVSVTEMPMAEVSLSEVAATQIGILELGVLQAGLAEIHLSPTSTTGAQLIEIGTTQVEAIEPVTFVHMLV